MIARLGGWEPVQALNPGMVPDFALLSLKKLSSPSTGTGGAPSEETRAAGPDFLRRATAQGR